MRKSIIFLVVLVLFMSTVPFGIVHADGESYQEYVCSHISQPVLFPNYSGYSGHWVTSDPATVVTDVDTLQVDNRFFLISSSYSYELSNVNPDLTWGCYYSPSLVPPQFRVDYLTMGYERPFTCVHVNLQGQISQWDPVDNTCRLQDIPNFWVRPMGGLNTEEKWYDSIMGENIDITTVHEYQVVPIAYGEPGVVSYFQLSGVGSTEPTLSKGTILNAIFNESTGIWDISAVLDENGTVELISQMGKPLFGSPDRISVAVYPFIEAAESYPPVDFDNLGFWTATVKLKAWQIFLPLLIK